MLVIKRSLTAAFALIAGTMACLAGGAEAIAGPSPNVTFELITPDEFVPGTLYTAQIKYAITGTDLENVVIAIDLPENVVVFGHGAVDSFDSYCNMTNNNRFDWACHFDADLLPVPSGGLSGQIPLTIGVPKWSVPAGTSFDLTATMTAQYDDEGTLTDIPQQSDTKVTPLATTTNTIQLNSSFHNDQEVGYADYNGVSGAVYIMYISPNNQGNGYVHPGANAKVQLPPGARFVKSAHMSNMSQVTSIDPWTSVSELNYTLNGRLNVPYVATQSQGSEGQLATAFSHYSTYARAHIWLPCDTLPLATDWRYNGQITGSTQADGGSPTTLFDAEIAPNVWLNQASYSCGTPGSFAGGGNTTIGPGQNGQISFSLSAPRGASPAYDAFVSIHLPESLQHLSLYDYIGWLRNGETHGFTKYACAIPEVTGELSRAQWETYRAQRCTVINDGAPDFTSITHIVTHADVWEVDEASVNVTYSRLITYLNFISLGCSGIGDTFIWSAHSSVRSTPTGTPEVHSAQRQVTVTGDASLYIPNYSKKATANRGDVERYIVGTGAHSSSAPPQNPWYTVDLPVGVVPISVEPYNSYGDCEPDYIKHEFTSNPDGTTTVRIWAGGDGTDVYGVNNCNSIGCTPGVFTSYYLTVFYDPAHPFTQGQVVSFSQRTNADNYPGSDRTSTFNITLQVPAEKRLTVEPVCDAEGSMGLRGTVSNSGGVPLSDLELVMPVPKVDDGSGTEIDTTYAYAGFDTSDDNLIVDCMQGGAWTPLADCNGSAESIRLRIAALAAFESIPVTMFLHYGAEASTGDIVRGTADLSSEELLDISTRESAPAKVDLCPGELSVVAWFDANGDGVPDSDETSLAGWSLTIVDLSRPELVFEIDIPNDGLVTTNLAAGSYGLTVTNPNAEGEATWSYTTVVPDEFDVNTGNTTNILIGAGCACADDDACTVDRCSVAGTCSYDWEEQPEISDDTCDGIDNNCDHTIDEGFAPVATSCGLGECADTGNTTCVNGVEGDTCTPTTATTETCDNLDNDCDGLTDGADDSLQPVSCELQNGVCAQSVKSRDMCVNGQWLACSAGDYAAHAYPLSYNGSVDTCDGYDNDCDAVVDENFVAQTVSCGVGACGNTGETRCTGGSIIELCIPKAPGKEVCDGVDNDCDGLTDAADSSINLIDCDNQSGVCDGSKRPAARCVSGSWQDCGPGDYAAFAPGLYSPTDDSCDAVDNDCSGTDDDDFNGEASTCGVGACAGNSGTTYCNAGQIDDSCDAYSGANSESCNAIDDDCDGETDETFGLGQGCDGDDSDQCANGVLVCDPEDASTTMCEEDSTDVVEICDNVDNDCDGETDEGCDDDGDGWCDAAMGCVPGACANGCGDCRDENTPANAAINPGADEICDNVDNDCNDETDEGCDDDFDGHCDAAIGCGPEGSNLCPYSCGDCADDDSEVHPNAKEVCDSIDNDCDETIDEGFDIGDDCQVGLGECVNSGALICNEDQNSTVCNAQPGAPNAELCDDKDNDCDGSTDEDFGLGDNCQVGEGACLSSVGSVICLPDNSAGCSAQPGTPSLDVCDAIDNDCDGYVDNQTNSPQISVCSDLDTEITSQPQVVTSSQNAVFDYIDPLDSEGGQAFECQLDGGDWIPCDGGSMTYTDLTLGAHTFLVRAIGPDGSRDQTPAYYAWVIDTSVPDTFIDSSPDNPSQSPDAAFDFSASIDDPAGYFCALDPQGEAAPAADEYVACNPHTAYQDLDEGPHELYVYVTNQAGTPDPSPAHYSWVIDLTAPETIITDGPDEVTPETTATFVYEDPDDADADSFLCRLDGGEWFSCNGGTVTFNELDEGPHRFEVAAMDSTGNVDPTPASYQWTVDNSPPNTFIPVAPTDPSQSSTAVFAFDSDEDVVTYYCVLDPQSVPPGADDYAPCDVSETMENLADGEHRIWVYAVDEAGNADPTPANYQWLIDTTFPETAFITKPASLVSPTDDNAFTYHDPDVADHDTFDCSLDGGPWLPCDNGATTPGALPLGTHEMAVRACQREIDQCDPTPAIYVWEVVDSPCPLDSSAPTITCGDSVSYECRGGVANVDVQSLAPNAEDACEPITVDWTAPELFSYGNTPIVFQATDGNGNLSTCITNIKVEDTAPPTITCPDDVTLSTPVDSCGVTHALASATVTDECFPDGLLTYNNAPTVYGVGETVVTWTTLDPAGNSDSCTMSVTVVDNVPLTLTCADTLSYDAPATACAWDGTLSATASDNCAVDVVVLDENNAYAIGQHDVVFNATDDADNNATCTTVLTVNDVTNPTAFCGELTGDVPAVLIATGDDACGATVEIVDVVCTQEIDGASDVLTGDACPVAVDGARLEVTERLEEGKLVLTYNVEATDPSGNTVVEECTLTFDPDQDNDGVKDSDDNCPTVANTSQQDSDEDGVGNACDVCADVRDPNQEDSDEDGVGDACDLCPALADDGDAQSDVDDDGYGDLCDVCPAVNDPAQADEDSNGVGDLCQDSDDDGILDTTTDLGPADNCVDTKNAEQLDYDEDGIGNACDALDDGIAAAGGGGCSGGSTPLTALSWLLAGLAVFVLRRRSALS